MKIGSETQLRARFKAMAYLKGTMNEIAQTISLLNGL
jgi:hypothetical protein